LFISKKDFGDSKIDEIISHERAHRNGFHSIDCLLLELITIVQWFNPIIWLMRWSLIAEHEFFADNSVLKEGFDKAKYQKLLFEKSLGISTLSLANNFNYSLLKKRMKMMTINKSGSYAKVKYLFALPLLFTIISFAITINSFGQNGEIYEEADVMARYNDGKIETVSNFIAENILYPKSAIDNNISARIFAQFVVDEKGKVKNIQIKRSSILDNDTKEVIVVGYKKENNPEIDSESVKDLENEVIRVIELLSGFTPAIKNGKNVSTQYTFPINFILQDKKKE
jgi:selenophosphate synthase